jgi:SAM-dependent methyltransferase
VVDFADEPPLELDEPIAARPPAASAPDEPSPAPPVSEPKTPAILAMRIIVVGESSRVQLRSDVPPPIESSPPPPPEAAETDVEVEPESPREGLETAEELTEEDVAPDSEDRPASEASGAPASEDPARKPPPPPRRPVTVEPAAQPAAAKEKTEAVVPREKKETLDDAPRARQRRPWWEELFGDDFIRATKRLSDKQIQQECSFIEESLGVAAGGVVLDLGCGSGQHAVELASRGYGVVGYDLSLFQLALAADVAQEADQRLNFLQGDMREMAFEEMFDGVYCWNTTFGYFEEEKNFAVAQRVFKALRPGGMFLLDVANRDFVVAQSPSQVWYEGEGCVCMDDMSVDFITSRLRVKRSVILDDGRTRECTYSIRLYSLHELGKLLHDVGFRVTEASGHPSMPGVFFGQSSPRIVILAQRP